MRVGLFCLILLSTSCDIASSGSKILGGSKSCAVKPAASTTGFAIRNGQDATATDYPFVGMLYAELPTSTLGSGSTAESGTSRRLCSGTLICPNVVLTAAHCFDGTANANLYYFVQGNSPGPTPQIDTATMGHGVQVRVLSPNGAVGANDIAMLQLDRSLADAPPPIWETAWADPGVASAGPPTTIIGYGTSETLQGIDTGSGFKKVGVMRLASTFSMPGTPSLDGLTQLYPLNGINSPLATADNACAGDSGGAAMIGNGLYGILTKIMYLKNGVPQTQVSCQQSNVTLITPIHSQLGWIKGNMADMCAQGSHITVYDQTEVTGIDSGGSSGGGASGC